MESDPGKGTRVRLQDGTIRVYEAAAIDHISYAGSPAAALPLQPAPTPPPAALEPPLTAAAAATPSPSLNAFQGAVRVESSEPGDVFIEGGEYGATPVVIPNLSVGQHKVIVRFHAGDDESRLVFVRGGAETTLHFEATAGLRAFAAKHRFRLGVGLETGFGLIDGDDAAPNASVIVRVNYAVTRIFEWRADVRLGAFASEIREADSYYGESWSEEGAPGLMLRTDGQLDLGSIYTVSFGLDLGGVVGVGPVVGAHISPIGFRIGSERAVLADLQVGATSGEDGVANFLLGVTYLFL
jgi:hypothetical protein